MFDLTFAALRRANVSRCALFHMDGVSGWSALEWAGCLAGEAGEAADVTKKMKRLDDPGCLMETKTNRTREQLRIDLAKELADVICYADLLAAREGIDLGQAVQDKFNLVSARNHVPQSLQNGIAINA
jgi:NTP pyrophosphatase (non-canonical NTP hydrolase)